MMETKIKNEILALCKKLGFKKDNNNELRIVTINGVYLLDTEDYRLDITDEICNYSTIFDAGREINGFERLLNLIKILFNE